MTKYIYSMIKDKKGGSDFEAFKEDGTIYKGFTCVAQVIVGCRENTFQVKWANAKVYEETGVTTEETEKQLRKDFAKWCL